MTPAVVLRRLSETTDWLRLRGVLSEAERGEMARFAQRGDRDRFALARATLRAEAGHALGLPPERVRIVRDAFGKPRLADAPGFAFNVSHSGDLVAIAFGHGAEIGVDVEAHRAGLDFAGVARRIFSPREQAALAGAGDPEAHFFRQWCFKEALVKALGTGLMREPRRFEILFEPEPVLSFVGAGEDDVGANWRFSILAAPAGYSGALAWRENS